ncbi:Alpha-terpineol synthase, chloroplastic [Linum perenne]
MASSLAAPLIYHRRHPYGHRQTRAHSYYPKITKTSLAATQAHEYSFPGAACRNIHESSSAVAPLTAVQRRSGNYGPNIWESHQYSNRPHRPSHHHSNIARVEELNKYVKENLLNINGQGYEMLVETIDKVQRLGIGYHFEDEIKAALLKLSSIQMPSLHFCALRFRLLRQNGIWTSPDILEEFKDDINNNINHQNEISGDEEVIRGLLSLYEASYLATPANQLERTLKFPSHWRIRRSEARWLIQQYQDTTITNQDIDASLLELAILDFNMVQLVYQNDLLELNMWWKEMGLPEKLEFARDRLVESFQWAVALAPEPQFSYCRKVMSKLTSLINVIDDVYDVYGSLDELCLFTSAIQRWNASEVELLPKYMQICFMAVYNTTNELAYHTLKQQGFNSLHYIKQAWQEQCRVYLEEAKMFHTVGYHQTFEEYLENGCNTVASRLVLIHTYAASGDFLTNEAFDYLANYPDLTRWVATISRLTNDLATSKAELERGDILKSIECYMKEKNVTDKEAREYIEWRIDEAWKRLNQEAMSNYEHMKMYVNQAVDFARGCHFMYHDGDANGAPTQRHKDRAMALLYHPFSIPAMEDNT